MEGTVDRSILNSNRVTGLKMELRGRVNGVPRSQRKVVVYGRQNQQHTGAMIEY